MADEVTTTSVKIPIEVDSSKAEKKIKSLEKAVGGLTESVTALSDATKERKNSPNLLDGMGKMSEESAKKIDSLIDKMDTLVTALGRIEESYSKAAKGKRDFEGTSGKKEEKDALTAEYRRLKASERRYKMERYVEKKTNPKATEAVYDQYKAEEKRAKMLDYIGKKQAEQKGIMSPEALYKSIKDTEKLIKMLDYVQAKTKMSPEQMASIVGIDNYRKYALGKIKMAYGEEGKEAAEPKTAGNLDAISESATRTAKALGVTLANGAAKAAKSLAMLTLKVSFAPILGTVKKATSALAKFGATASNLFRQIKRVVMYRAIRSAIRMVTDGFKEGTQNAYQWSKALGGDFAASMDRLATASLYLKNSLGAMVTPLINALAPALDFLIDKFVALLNVANQVIALLTGAKTWTKAIRYPKEYAEAANTAAGGAGKLAKAMTTILSIDELNPLNADNGGGGGGGGGGGNALDYASMFETADISTNFMEMWEKADFTALGVTLGNKINEALEKINWTKLQNTASKVGKSVATFLNGAIETINWKSVGSTLSSGLNTAVQGMFSFVKNFKWKSLGTAIGDAINGALKGINWTLIKGTATKTGQGLADTINTSFKTINWSAVGKTLANGLNTAFNFIGSLGQRLDFAKAGKSVGTAISAWAKTFDWKNAGVTVSSWATGFLDFLINAIEETDWTSLGQGLSEFISNIDWIGIIKKGLQLVGSLVVAVSEFIEGLFKDFVDAFNAKFTDKALNGSGEDLWTGFLNGIKNAVTGIGTWIYNNLWVPFRDWFKDAFGIHSPSTKMEEFGGDIVQGLYNGLSNVWSTIKGIFEALVKSINDFFKDPVGTIKLAIETVTGGSDEHQQQVVNSTLMGLHGAEGSTVNGGSGSIEIGVTPLIKDPRYLREETKVLLTTPNLTPKINDPTYASGVKSKISTPGMTPKMQGVTYAKGVEATITTPSMTPTLKTPTYSSDAVEAKYKTPGMTPTLKSPTYADGVKDKLTKTTMAATLTGGSPTTLDGYNSRTQKLDIPSYANFNGWGYTGLSGYNASSQKVAFPSYANFGGWSYTGLSGYHSSNSRVWFPSYALFDDYDTTFTKVKMALQITEAYGPNGNRIQLKENGGAFYGGKWHDISQFATGGVPDHGSLYIAGEAGSELVGHIGGRSEVLNQSQIATTIASATAMSNASQNSILSQLLAVAQQIYEGQGDVRAYIPAGEVVQGLQRSNRRDGRAVVPMGV